MPPHFVFPGFYSDSQSLWPPPSPRISRRELLQRYNRNAHRNLRRNGLQPSIPAAFFKTSITTVQNPRQILGRHGPPVSAQKRAKPSALPASSDIGYLAMMLSDLRAAVEKQVGPVTSAGVTAMDLVALYDENLHDAFEYVGLEYITFPVGYVGHNILYETGTALRRVRVRSLHRLRYGPWSLQK